MDKNSKKEPITDAFRYKVVSDYFNKGGSYKEVAIRNGVTESTLYRWIRIFAPTSEPIIEPSDEVTDMEEAEKKKLEKRIKDLEKALEYSNLRADAYKKVIDIAEETFNIPILKKSGTKQ